MLYHAGGSPTDFGNVSDIPFTDPKRLSSEHVESLSESTKSHKMLNRDRGNETDGILRSSFSVSRLSAVLSRLRESTAKCTSASDDFH